MLMIQSLAQSRNPWRVYIPKIFILAEPLVVEEGLQGSPTLQFDSVGCNTERGVAEGSYLVRGQMLHAFV